MLKTRTPIILKHMLRVANLNCIDLTEFKFNINKYDFFYYEHKKCSNNGLIKPERHSCSFLYASTVHDTTFHYRQHIRLLLCLLTAL